MYQSSFTLLYEIGALQTFLFIISLLDTSFIRALQCPTKYFVVVTADCDSDSLPYCVLLDGLYYV